MRTAIQDCHSILREGGHILILEHREQCESPNLCRMMEAN